MTRELAILLVQTRQFLIYVALFMAFAISVDLLIKPKKLKRKIIGLGVVSFASILRMAIELYLGLAIYEGIIVLALSLISILIIMFMDY